LLLAPLLCALALGCGKPASKPVAAAGVPAKISTKQTDQTPTKAATQQPPAFTAPAPAIEPPREPVPPTREPRSKQAPLADLVAQAEEHQFDLPERDEGKLAVAGIRKLAGKHIVLYTDLPAGEVDELPAVFDAAVPLWARYFGVDPAKVADWKIVGHVMKDKERFLGAGLFPPSLPDFPNGFSTGSQLWLYDQPSPYYRRHLLLHEGTHCFMFRWLGGAGPPWYMEGMAELLATHSWQPGKLTLGVMPRLKDDFPYWGRVRIMTDEYAEGRGMSLADVMRYDTHAHLRNEPYGWCWGAAAFLDEHPLTQVAFRDLKQEVRDRSIDFSRRLEEKLASHWREINDDWQVFVIDCDYGYDFARAAAVRKDAVPLPAAGGTVELATDRGWQSTGYLLEAGKTYSLQASGRYEVATSGEKPWPCEAGGITLRYHKGHPLGMLMAAVADEKGTLASSLGDKRAIGLASTLTPTESGVLYLSINEAASGLADNKGMLRVEIRAE
jgi:hypothetical protein